MSFRNRVLLDGALLDPVTVRTTPSGVPVARFDVESAGPAEGLAPLETLKLRITVVAMGPLAELCRRLTPGTPLEIEGSLNRVRRDRGGAVRWGAIELMARRITPGEAQPLSTPQGVGAAPPDQSSET